MLITIYNTNFTLHRHNLHNFDTETHTEYTMMLYFSSADMLQAR